MAPPASQYPERWKNDGAAFLNDWEREYLMMVAPRKVGKSSIGAVKVGLYAMKCDPEWPIFQENGIEYREWDGNPKQVVIASFAPENMAQLWAVYQEFLPRYELGPYAPNWGMYPGEEGRQKFLNFHLNLMCQKILMFLNNLNYHLFHYFPMFHLTR